MEPTIQMSLFYLLVILATSRRTVAMPGIIGLRKNPDGGSSSGKDHSHGHHRRHSSGTDATEIEKLHNELHRVTRELAQTKEILENLREEVSEKLNNLSVHSPTNMEMSCRTSLTLWHDTVGKTLEYLDNFDVHCHQNEFLRQWRMTWGERGKKKAMKFVCCKFVPKTNSETRWQGH